MTVKILELAGKRYAILPEKDFRRLAAQAGEGGWPPRCPKCRSTKLEQGEDTIYYD